MTLIVSQTTFNRVWIDALEQEWDWLLDKESRDDRRASESVFVQGRFTGVSGTAGEME